MSLHGSIGANGLFDSRELLGGEGKEQYDRTIPLTNIAAICIIGLFPTACSLSDEQSLLTNWTEHERVDGHALFLIESHVPHTVLTMRIMRL